MPRKSLLFLTYLALFSECQNPKNMAIQAKQIHIDIEVQPIFTGLIEDDTEELRDQTTLADSATAIPSTKFEVNLVNYFNAQYIGHLYIGGPEKNSTDGM